MKKLYKDKGEGNYTAQEVIEVIKRLIDTGVEVETLRAGLLFAADFSNYVGGWGDGPDGDAVTQLTVKEGILDFDTVEQAWAEESETRKVAAARVASFNAGGPTAPPDSPYDLDSFLLLYNRGRFDRDIVRLLAAVGERNPISFVMMDIDLFKQVNDRSGHPAGDEVLQKAASVIKNVCEGKGFPYRYGGDEMAILLPNYCEEEALALAERIRGEFANASFETYPYHVTMSTGVATCRDPSFGAGKLVEIADKAMYAFKKGS